LAITNTFEGAVFVSSATANGTLTQYVTNAIPTLDDADVNSVVEIYSNIPGLNTVLSQAIAVQGERRRPFSIFLKVRPILIWVVSHLHLPHLFLVGCFWKQEPQSMPSLLYPHSNSYHNALQGEFAIPPGGHGNDVAYYFNT
jgi:hypothetical protein